MDEERNVNLSMEQHRLLLQLRRKTGRLGVLLKNGFTEQALRDMIKALLEVERCQTLSHSILASPLMPKS